MQARIAFAAAALLLAGCVEKPLAFDCGAHPLADFSRLVEPTPGGIARAAAQPTSEFEAELRPPANSQVSHALVVLSGGGQWGAYGAGFLKGWRTLAPGDPLARPDLPWAVTGISTGALQATPVFLGPGYDAVLLNAYQPRKQTQYVRDHGSLWLLSHASIADQRRLYRFLLGVYDGHAAGGPDLIAEVAHAGDPGVEPRKLFVGVVNAKSGALEAINLVALARAWGPGEALDDHTRAERDECYTGAIVASAAIPITFRQVTVDAVPRLDGGVRQAVFSEQAVSGFAATANKAPQGSSPALAVRSARPYDKVFVIFNEPLGIAAIEDAQLRASVLNEVGYTFRPMLDQLQQTSLANVGQFARSQGLPAFYTSSDEASDTCRRQPGSDFAKYRFFAPDFMKCLVREGERAGADPRSWTPIPASP